MLLDLDRSRRIGIDEAILCSGKTADQIGDILEIAETVSVSLLLTRLSGDLHAALPVEVQQALDYDDASETAFFGTVVPTNGAPSVAVLSAGASDRRIAREAERTLEYYGHRAVAFRDIGVAGLWRLQERIDQIRRYPVVIVVAGMDGALPSVVGGLCPGVVIAVPTSTGYGIARGGETALFAALTSCSPGVLVTNIDNGYGAAVAAVRVINAHRLPVQPDT